MNKDLTQQEYDILQSKTFNWLRFPLIFLILFIHTLSLSEFTDSSFVLSIEYFFRKTLAGLGVPFFFIVSGYYFFYTRGEDRNLLKESYFNKLRKRVKTLVIPYIFWNLLVVLFYLIVPRILGGFNPENQISNISDVFKAFWCYPYTPINYPLWYMRDLIVLVLLSPLIYLLIKYLKFIPILIFGIVYFASIKLDVVRFDLLSQTLFFFPLGAYFAIEKRNILKCCRSLSFYPIVLYFILIVFDVILKNDIVDRLSIFIGLIAIFNVISYYIEKEKIKENKTLSNASFFIFAFHSVPILVVANRLIAILPQKNWAYLFNFFASVIVVLLVGLATYIILKKIFPRLTSVITGGR